MRTAAEIAAEFSSGQDYLDLERAILRHMEHHINITRDGVFTGLMEAANSYKEASVIRAFLRQQMQRREDVP